MYYLVEGLAKSTISDDGNDMNTRIRRHSLARTRFQQVKSCMTNKHKLTSTNRSIEAEVGKNNNHYPFPLFFQKTEKMGEGETPFIRV